MAAPAPTNRSTIRSTTADTDLPPWLSAPLAQVLANHRGHALLVHGPAGLGHWELALAVARGWLCEGTDAQGQPMAAVQGRACGRCVGCQLFASRSHPDLRVLMPQDEQLRRAWGAGADPDTDGAESGEASAAGAGSSKGRKPSRDIKVDDIRRAGDWCARSSSRGGLKVLLLHPAQAMNATAANALLKTLEEPPAPVRLLLTATEPERLLPTVRSRCQAVALPAPGREAALQWLRAQGLAGEAVMLDAAGGRPLEALALAGEGMDADFWATLARRVATADPGPLLGLPVPRAIDALLKLCHDAMAVAAGAAPRFLPSAGFAQPCSVAAAVAWHAELRRAARHVDHPWQAPLLLEALVAGGRSVWRPAAAGSLHSTR